MIKDENNGVLLNQTDMVVVEVVTTEQFKGDKRKITMKVGDEMKVIVEAPAEGLQPFRKNQVVDVKFSTPQRTL